MQAVLLRKTDVCLPFYGLRPETPQRRAAVHSLRLSISCSAHSHANAPELELVCNITEAPPVADEARRCWRKTRSIAPAPRAIGDYVLRGLNGLRSKTHEPVLFERSEFTGECAEQLIESRKLSTAARRCGCRAGTARLLFFCRRFLFQIKRKCRNAGSIYLLIIVRSEGKSPF